MEDVAIALADAELKARLERTVAELAQAGYEIDGAVLVVAGALPDGDRLRAYRAVLDEGEEERLLRLLIWAIDAAARDVGLIDDEADPRND